MPWATCSAQQVAFGVATDCRESRKIFEASGIEIYLLLHIQWHPWVACTVAVASPTKAHFSRCQKAKRHWDSRCSIATCVPYLHLWYGEGKSNQNLALQLKAISHDEILSRLGKCCSGKTAFIVAFLTLCQDVRLTESSFWMEWPVCLLRILSRACFWAKTSLHLICTSIACLCPVVGTRGCCSIAAPMRRHWKTVF